MKNHLAAAAICLLLFCALGATAAGILTKKPGQAGFRAVVETGALPPGEKTYCSTYMKTKYKLLVVKNKITITRLYKEYKDVFTGVIKNGKVYSNDPEEKKYKSLWGKYYKLEKNAFSVLNPENGDYDQFTLCDNP